METTTRCPICAEDVAVEATICPFCGARLRDELEGYCTTCHAVVEADAAGTCRRCGGRLADLHARPPAAAGAPSAAADVAGVVPAGPPPAAAAVPPAAPAADLAQAPSWWTGRAGPRPPLGARLRMAFIVVAVPLVVVGVIVGVIFLATGGIEMLKPVAPVTFDTIGQYPDERHVTLEGRLRLPGHLSCDSNCGVYLVDPANSEREIPLFIDVAGYKSTAAPNQMERLSYLYETKDFRVHLDSGIWVGDGALVRVTGHVCHTEVQKDVCLHAQKIQAPTGTSALAGSPAVSATPTAGPSHPAAPTATAQPTTTARPTATALPTTAASAPPLTVRLMNAAAGFELWLPANWRSLEPGDAAWVTLYGDHASTVERDVESGAIRDFAVPLEPRDADGTVNLTVYVQENTTYASHRAAADAYLEVLDKVAAGAIRRDEVLLTAGPASRFVALRGADGSRLVAYILVGNGRAHYLVFASGGATSDAYAATFLAIASSFRYL